MRPTQPETLFNTIIKARELIDKLITDKSDRKELTDQLIHFTQKLPSIFKKQENEMGKTFKDGDKSKKIIKRSDKTKMSNKKLVKKKGKK